MPCFRCERVQTDPQKGAAPWGRGVRSGSQILICPDCQEEQPGWTEELDRCPRCKSTRLSLVLGSVVCRQCDYMS